MIDLGISKVGDESEVGGITPVLKLESTWDVCLGMYGFLNSSLLDSIVYILSGVTGFDVGNFEGNEVCDPNFVVCESLLYVFSGISRLLISIVLDSTWKHVAQ